MKQDLNNPLILINCPKCDIFSNYYFSELKEKQGQIKCPKCGFIFPRFEDR